MDKLLLFPGKTDRGVFTYLIDHEKNFLEKTAAEHHPTIASYISAARPIRGKTQILLTALGAGEFWGCNVNGDYFPETALAHEGDDYGYKTFEKYAKIYKHHVNKDPTAAFGEVALSVYNPKYHRVELIVVLDNMKAPDIAQRMEHGDYPDWSMGCRVPFDVCNICGNKAPTRKQYCEHLKYYLARIVPELNRQAYALNYTPRFFDISQVLIGADRIAKTHMKVASARVLSFPGSAWLAEKMAVSDKAATIEKEVPTDAPPASQTSLNDLARGIMEVKAHEPSLPRSLVDRLSGFPLGESMSTMAMMGMLPKPQEFQRIILIQCGRRDWADELDQEGTCFDPMSVEEPSPDHQAQLGLDHRSFNPYIMQMLSPHMADRSYYPPHLGKRLTIMVKSGQEEPLPRFVKVAVSDEKHDTKERKPVGIIPMLALAAGLYAAFAKKAPTEAVKGLDKTIASNPGLIAALGLGLYATFNSLAKPGAKGNYVDHERVNPDANDVFARIEQAKKKPYVKLGAIGSAAKRLGFGIPGAYMVSGGLQKHKELTPYEEEGRIKSFLRRNPDIVSGAIAADAVLSSQGKGTAKVFQMAGKAKEKLLPAMKQMGSYFAKAAAALEDIPELELEKVAFSSAQEFAANALVWPLAMGKANLPGRVVSGLFDQAAMDAMSRMVEKRKSKHQQGIS